MVQIKYISGTLLLVLLNVIVFSIFSEPNPANSTQYLDCLIQNAPQCLVPVSENEAINCASGIDPKASVDVRNCLYNISPSCARESTTNICLSPTEKTINGLSFQPYSFSHGRNLESVLTSMFMHVDSNHLWGNMIALVLAGMYVERRLGTIKYLLFYISVGILATLFYYAFNTESTTYLLGASGAISGLFSASLILHFFKPVENYVSVPRLNVSYLVISIALQFMYAFFRPESNVAYLGHVGGIIFGVLMVFVLKKRTDSYITTPVD
ncbi:MAG: rhomboid family intramembrane serine protease [Patescibacteria group bacterium]